MGRTCSKNGNRNAQRVLVEKEQKEANCLEDPDVSGRKTFNWTCRKWVEWIELIWFRTWTGGGGASCEHSNESIDVGYS
jgi:hypothetical protein